MQVILTCLYSLLLGFSNRVDADGSWDVKVVTGKNGKKCFLYFKVLVFRNKTFIAYRIYFGNNVEPTEYFGM